MSENRIKICVLQGDGVGPEVTDEAVKVLKAVCESSKIELETDYALIGGAAIDEEGIPLPPKTVERCRAASAVLLGAVGGSKWKEMPAHLRPEAGLLGIRAKLGLFANLRPCKVFEALKENSPLKNAILEKGADVVMVRELTGGIYFGEKGTKETDGYPAGYDVMQYSEPEVERIVRTAFEIARKRRKKVASVDKANILESSRLWRSVVERTALEYPDVQYEHFYVDHVAMQLVKDPAQFDVLVTGNMFGDILSDELAMIVGSIGMLPSASVGHSGVGLYGPVHGALSEIAGQQKANPLAAILSAAMMLRHSFSLEREADAVEKAVEESLAVMRTPDVECEGILTASTSQVGSFVADRVLQLLK